MKELAGRLSALDPAASETFKVITYFDTLVQGRVGIDGMLRGAAVLCGATIGRILDGAESGRRHAADGSDLPAGTPHGWPTGVADDGSRVWLERSGEAHANDAMVLDRLALAVSVTSMRLDTQAPKRRAIETLLSGDADLEDREEAITRLGLGSQAQIRAVAVPAGIPMDRPLPNAIIASPFGIVRAVVMTATADAPARRAGMGIAVRPGDDVRASWRSALTSLRLTDDETPVVSADSLGVLLQIAEAADHDILPHPDVLTVGQLASGPWTERMLRLVVSAASQRTLATAAGVHHSTMGVRLEELPRLLGYDPSDDRGRTRLGVALMLHRLADTNFHSSGDGAE